MERQGCFQVLLAVQIPKSNSASKGFTSKCEKNNTSLDHHQKFRNQKELPIFFRNYTEDKKKGN